MSTADLGPRRTPPANFSRANDGIDSDVARFEAAHNEFDEYAKRAVRIIRSVGSAGMRMDENGRFQDVSISIKDGADELSFYVAGEHVSADDTKTDVDPHSPKSVVELVRVYVTKSGKNWNGSPATTLRRPQTLQAFQNRSMTPHHIYSSVEDFGDGIDSPDPAAQDAAIETIKQHFDSQLKIGESALKECAVDAPNKKRKLYEGSLSDDLKNGEQLITAY